MENRLRPCASWSSFVKTTISRRLRRWNELKIQNTKKYGQKTVGISFMCGCKCVVGYALLLHVDACFYEVKPGYERSALGKQK